MTRFPTMGLLFFELIWLLSSVIVLADMIDNKASPWPDGGNSDLASKGSVKKERRKRNTGSRQFCLLPYLYLPIKFEYIHSQRAKPSYLLI